MRRIRLDDDVVRLGGGRKAELRQLDRPHDVLRPHVDDRNLRVVLNADVQRVSRVDEPDFLDLARGGHGASKPEAPYVLGRRYKPEAPYKERRGQRENDRPNRPRHLSDVFTMNRPCSILLTMIVPLLKNG